MRILLTILFSMIIGVGLSQRTAPTSLPSPNSTGYSKVGFYRGDSAFLMGPRLDTNWIPVTQALITFKPIGADTGRLFYYDGRKWKEANKIDTSSLSNRINLKVDSVSVSTDSFYYWVNGNPNFFYKNVDSFYYTIQQLDDTSALILRSDGIVDTLAITSGDASLSLDTTSLSNRINSKLSLTDTAAMLSPYLRYAYRTPGVDSIYFVKGDGSVLAVKDSAGGGGITGTITTDRLVFSANGQVKDTSTLVYQRSTGSVGINTTPDASAALDVSSTTKGVLIPRVTTAERDAIVSPSEGLKIYNLSSKSHQGFDATSWRSMTSDTTPIVQYTRLLGGSNFAWSSIGGWLEYFEATTSITTGNIYFQAIFVPYVATVTGLTYTVSHTQTSTSLALYRLDSDSIRYVDSSVANSGSFLSLWNNRTLTSSRTIQPGIYYVAIRGLNSSGQSYATVTGVNTPTLIQSMNSSRTNIFLYGSLAYPNSSGSFPASLHANQITRSTRMQLVGLY